MATFRLNLPAAELESLRQLACGAPRRLAAASVGAALVRHGFARTNAGLLTITTLGRAKLIFELTRASWKAVVA